MFYIRNLQGTSFNTNRKFSRRLFRDKGSPSQNLLTLKKEIKKENKQRNKQKFQRKKIN